MLRNVHLSIFLLLQNLHILYALCVLPNPIRQKSCMKTLLHCIWCSNIRNGSLNSAYCFKCHFANKCYFPLHCYFSLMVTSPSESFVNAFHIPIAIPSKLFILLKAFSSTKCYFPRDCCFPLNAISSASLCSLSVKFNPWPLRSLWSSFSKSILTLACIAFKYGYNNLHLAVVAMYHCHCYDSMMLKNILTLK